MALSPSGAPPRARSRGSPLAYRTTSPEGTDFANNIPTGYKNNRIEQDHRGVKQRYYPMRGFGSFASAARFCAGFEEQRQYFRPRTRPGERVTLADRRRRFRERWAAVLTELAAA